MLSEILKIVPRLDNAALQSMDRTLSGRFAKIAKGFGKGMKSIFKGGGWMALAAGLLNKLLNPLKETQDVIEKLLKSSDDIVTNAGQFDTSSGKLFKLVQMAKATGLDESSLFTLMTKFQTAVAEAKEDPSKPSAVRGFTDEKDSAAAFFSFIQSLQKMTKDQQIVVQKQVFGEKQILKMSDFLQSDFSRLYKSVGLNKVTAAGLTKNLNHLGGLNDYKDEGMARNETFDVGRKAGLITKGIMNAQLEADRIAKERENKNIAQYENLAQIAKTTAQVEQLITDGLAKLGKFVADASVWMTSTAKSLNKMMNSGIMKSIFGGKGN